MMGTHAKDSELNELSLADKNVQTWNATKYSYETVDTDDTLPNEDVLLQRKSLVKVYWVQFVAAACYSIISTAKAVSFFPFLRTTVDCDSEVLPEDRSSNKWSGSIYCTDLDYVAREAQYLKGLADGLDQAVHCLVLPMLGHAIDCFGRRWGVLFGMFGVTMQCFCFTLASISDYGYISHFFVVFGSMIQGGSGIFMAAINASIRDVQLASHHHSEKEESRAFGLLQAFQGLASFFGVIIVTWFVVAKNFENYDEFWACVTLVAVFFVIFFYFMYQETVIEKPEWNWNSANPLYQLQKIYSVETHRWIAFSLFTLVMAMTSLTMLQAFTVAQYNWSQTYSTTVTMILSPFMVISLAASYILIPRLGPFKFMEIAYAFANAGILSLCFSIENEAFVYIGMACLFSTVGAAPAYMQIVSRTIAAHEIGQILANLGAVALGAVAIGNVFYSVIFRLFKFWSNLSFMIAFPFILLSTYCASLARIHAEADLTIRDAQAGVHLTSGIEHTSFDNNRI